MPLPVAGKSSTRNCQNMHTISYPFLTTVDQIIAVALSSQLSARQVRDSVEQRARCGKLSDLDEVLAAVPDVAPVAGDER